MESPQNPEKSTLKIIIRQALKDIRREEVDDDWWHASALFRLTQRNNSYRNSRQVINHILQDAIAQLDDALQARILHLRFFDKLSVRQVTHQLNLAESTIHAYQGKAIDNLADRIHAGEAQAHTQIRSRLADRLLISGSAQLVGMESVLNQLLDVVRQPGPPWLLSIEGIGGIGKTSLAHTLLQRAIEVGEVEEIGWATAKTTEFSLAGEILYSETPALTAQDLIHQLIGQLMPELSEAGGLGNQQALERLQSYLRQIPHLIVIDNLETVADSNALLPTLQQLANPTRFILTTRQSLHGQADAFFVRLSELDQSQALQLVRQEARQTNLPEIARAGDHTLHPIYETVGGNPLALRLLVGQLHVHDLPTIIQDLRSARGMAADNLYTFIYRHAWGSLDESSRQALLAMALLRPQGDTSAFLGQVSNLPPDELRTAIEKLVKFNLVEVRGNMHARLYAIHSLTRTFLLEQVAKWM